MDKKTMLHSLRTPDRRDKTELRKARLQAADELERLYTIEKKLQNFLKQSRKVRNYSNTNDVFKAIPVAVLMNEKFEKTKEECQYCSITPCACELHG